MKRFLPWILGVSLMLTMPGSAFSLDSFELPSRELQNISEVYFNVSGNLELTQGPELAFRMEGPQRLLDKIVVETRKNALYIKSKPLSIITVPALRVYVTLPEINYISTSSSGNIRSEQVNSLDLTVKSTSSGDIDIDAVQAVQLTLRTSSSGNITIDSGLVEKTDIRISSSGDVTIRGSAAELRANLSSSGNLKSAEFQTETADITLSSSGDAAVWVTGELEARLSSSGDLHVWGTPVLKNRRITSSGDIIGKGEK